MPIEVAAPPTTPSLRTSIRNSYIEFIDQVLQNPHDWVSIPLSDVTGVGNIAKQSSVLRAARVREVRIQTTVQEGRIYACLLTPITVILQNGL